MRLLITPLLTTCLLSITACGGGSSSGGNDSGGGDNSGGGSPAAPATAANPGLSFVDAKTFRFTWTDVADATYYRLFENPDGVSGFTQVQADIAQGTQSIDLIVPLYARINAAYMLQSCNDVGCSDSAEIVASGNLVDSIGYFKASNAGANDWFGSAVSLSADGNTLAVGAREERSAATGIDGDQADNSVTHAGAVYVFIRTGSVWSQQSYVKASNTDTEDRFGRSVSLSADGNTLAVGAPFEYSAATGIDGDQNDNSAGDAGAVYVFSRTDSAWSQQAYLKASNAGMFDNFGLSVSLSVDGNTLAVGAQREHSAAIGIGGDQSDDSAISSGAVYVFNRTGILWSQQAYLKASNTDQGDTFGAAVSLSADGGTLAVGAFAEDSSATGIDGDQSDNSVSSAGAVYVFSRAANSWSQQAYLKASNTNENDQFGVSVSLSANGNTLAVGAYVEDSAATGIDGDQSDNSAQDAGAVYVFSRAENTWSQQVYLKASNADAFDRFGNAVSLSDDGNTLAVAAYYEYSAAAGVGGNQMDNSAQGAGAVYVFSRAGSVWSQQAYLKASNPDAFDRFGSAVSLSADGNALAVGSIWERSGAMGIGGDQSDNSVNDVGAVYLY